MALIEVSRAGAVAGVVLNRPEALNAISTAFAGELAVRMRELAADGSVRAAVLRANGEKVFCVGADLKERNGFSDAEFLAQRLAYSVWRAAAFSADRAEGIRAFSEKRPPEFGSQPS